MPPARHAPLTVIVACGGSERVAKQRRNRRAYHSEPPTLTAPVSVSTITGCRRACPAGQSKSNVCSHPGQRAVTMIGIPASSTRAGRRTPVHLGHCTVTSFRPASFSRFTLPHYGSTAPATAKKWIRRQLSFLPAACAHVARARSLTVRRSLFASPRLSPKRLPQTTARDPRRPGRGAGPPLLDPRSADGSGRTRCRARRSSILSSSLLGSKCLLPGSHLVDVSGLPCFAGYPAPRRTCPGSGGQRAGRSPVGKVAGHPSAVRP